MRELRISLRPGETIPAALNRMVREFESKHAVVGFSATIALVDSSVKVAVDFYYEGWPMHFEEEFDIVVVAQAVDEMKWNLIQSGLEAIAERELRKG